MKTPGHAILWELLTRGRWTFIAAFLAANLLPVLLETVLQSLAEIDPLDQSQIQMQLFLVQLNMFVFGAFAIGVQGHPSRLFAAPLTNTTLTLYHLVPVAVLVGCDVVLSTWMMNSLFPLHWPLWGPALYGVAVTMALLASLWQSERSIWMIPVLACATGLSGIWYRLRFGELNSSEIHMWSEITSVEVITLISVMIVSFFVARQGLARRRAGETLPSFGLIEAYERLVLHRERFHQPFVSADDALFWSIWSQKGWILPTTVLAGGLFMGTVWSLTDRTPHELLHGLIASGPLLTLMSVVGGIMIGNLGSSDKSTAMRGFIASHPLTTRKMGHVIVKVLLTSVTLACAIWACTLAIVLTVLWAFQIEAGIRNSPQMIALYLSLALLGPWTAAGLTASLSLTGRSWLLPATVAVLTTVAVAINFWTLAFLTRESREVLMDYTILCANIGCIAGALIVPETAYRRRLIPNAGRWAAPALLVVSFIILTSVIGGDSRTHWTGITALTAGLALATVPFSAIPLALSVNRIR